MTTQHQVPNPGFTPDERYLENIILEKEPICQLPGGCQHGHPSTGGVQFMTVTIGGTKYRVCGGDYEALLERRGREHTV